MDNSSDAINNDEVIDILKEIFKNINDWLIFAETKNGVLLSINGILLFRILDYLGESDVDNTLLNIKMIWILIIIFLVAILIILKSFFPNSSVLVDENNNASGHSCNSLGILIFYKDISKYECSKLYLQDIYKYYLNIYLMYILILYSNITVLLLYIY